MTKENKLSRGDKYIQKQAVGNLRRTMWGVSVISIFINLLMLTGPIYMLQVYDRVLTSGAMPTLVGLSVLMTALFVGWGLLDWCRNRIFNEAANIFTAKLSPVAVNAMLDDISDPDITRPKTHARANIDLRLVKNMLSSPTMGAMFDLPMLPFFLLVLWALHWMYLVWALIGMIILTCLSLMNRRLNYQLLRDAETEKRRSDSMLEDMRKGTDISNSLGIRGALYAKWFEQDEKSEEAMRSSTARVTAVSGVSRTLRMILQSGILGLGAWLSIIQLSTPGAMIAASIILGRAVVPIEQVVAQWKGISEAWQAWARLGLTDLGNENSDPAASTFMLPAIKGSLQCSNLHVGPGSHRPAVLRGVDFQVEAGTCLGLIGQSGSGKTSLLKALMGVWPAAAGTVRYDGADISQMGRAWLGQQIGYMPQVANLNQGTIFENISRFQNDPDETEIVETAKRAGCHNLILGLDRGYDTWIDTHTHRLSTGQSQRISLARAMFGDPKIIFLDEPTANLDPEGVSELVDALGSAKEAGVTLVIATHRRDILVLCDKLLRLQNGEIHSFGDTQKVLSLPKQRIKP